MHLVLIQPAGAGLQSSTILHTLHVVLHAPFLTLPLSLLLLSAACRHAKHAELVDSSTREGFTRAQGSSEHQQIQLQQRGHLGAGARASCCFCCIFECCCCVLRQRCCLDRHLGPEVRSCNLQGVLLSSMQWQCRPKTEQQEAAPAAAAAVATAAAAAAIAPHRRGIMMRRAAAGPHQSQLLLHSCQWCPGCAGRRLLSWLCGLCDPNTGGTAVVFVTGNGGSVQMSLESPS